MDRIMHYFTTIAHQKNDINKKEDANRNRDAQGRRRKFGTNWRERIPVSFLI